MRHLDSLKEASPLSCASGNETWYSGWSPTLRVQVLKHEACTPNHDCGSSYRNPTYPISWYCGFLGLHALPQVILLPILLDPLLAWRPGMSRQKARGFRKGGVCRPSQRNQMPHIIQDFGLKHHICFCMAFGIQFLTIMRYLDPLGLSGRGLPVDSGRRQASG